MATDAYGVSGWEPCEEMSRMDGGGDIRRLEKNEDYAVGVILGLPYGRRLHWDGSSFNTCEGDGCVYCADNVSVSKKFWFNFFTLSIGNGDSETGTPEALEILEISSKGFKSMLRCKAKYGLEKQAFEVKRSGTGLDTEYGVLPDMEIASLPDDVKAKLDEAKGNLVDLAALAARFATGGGSDEDAKPKPAQRAKQSGGKIDSETAGDIAARLRVIDRAVARELLKKYGARSVGQIDASKVAPFLQDLSEAEGDSDGEPWDY